MSDFHGAMLPDDQLDQPRTSRLAVASFVSSLLCCVPITTIPAILFGIAAVFSIRGNPMRRGMWMAVTGIVLGLIFTVCQVGVAYGWHSTNTIAYQILKPGFNGDYTSMRAAFGATGTDEEAKVFVEELRSRYGELQGSDLDWQDFMQRVSQQQQQQQQSMAPPAKVFPSEIIFENARVQSELTMGNNALGSIRVIDPGGDDLIFPSTAGGG